MRSIPQSPEQIAKSRAEEAAWLELFETYRLSGDAKGAVIKMYNLWNPEHRPIRSIAATKQFLEAIFHNDKFGIKCRNAKVRKADIAIACESQGNIKHV